MTFLVNRTQAIVEWGHCDPVGVVFPSRLFEYFDAGSWALFEAALGVARARLATAFDIMGVPLVDARLNVLKPVRFGDVVEILSSIGEFRRSSFDVQHRLMLAGALAVEGRETRVWAAADQDGKLHARPIPPEIKARFITA